MTEIYDYLRVLFARIGIPYSPYRKPIVSQSISDMVDRIKITKRKYYLFTSTNSKSMKGEYKKEILNYKKRGFTKIKVDGNYLNIDDFSKS